ncbi:MAG: hypothetical protein UW87_C0049G0003 [Candidatus Moranbacteria bacterium GW2011_GWC2_45_10]|nr:MAG: hypothetical protein UW87_C0049G0003 [Candidatus Moranbacteria bacterium GW2011_GWC2_45_10]
MSMSRAEIPMKRASRFDFTKTRKTTGRERVTNRIKRENANKTSSKSNFHRKCLPFLNSAEKPISLLGLMYPEKIIIAACPIILRAVSAIIKTRMSKIEIDSNNLFATRPSRILPGVKVSDGFQLKTKPLPPDPIKMKKPKNQRSFFLQVA